MCERTVLGTGESQLVQLAMLFLGDLLFRNHIVQVVILQSLKHTHTQN